MAGGGAGGDAQTHRPWGFPTVSPSHPSVFPHHGIQRITVELSENSQKKPLQSNSCLFIDTPKRTPGTAFLSCRRRRKGALETSIAALCPSVHEASRHETREIP